MKGRRLRIGSAVLLLAVTAGSAGVLPEVTPRAVAQPSNVIDLPPLAPRPAASPGQTLLPRPSPSKKPKLLMKPRPKPTRTYRPAKRKPVETVTRISGYVYCGSAVAAAQRCIDAGELTLYYPAGVKTLAGHNYMGWSWMDDLPVGRTVVISSGSLAGTYRVYGHGWARRGSQGGTFPSAGRGASAALQTCTSNGTGFSFLRRT